MPTDWLNVSVLSTIFGNPSLLLFQIWYLANWNIQKLVSQHTRGRYTFLIKQIDSMFPWVCSVIDLRRRQNVVRTSVTHSAIASCATFLFLPHFDVFCDLLLNRRTATWNLFVKENMIAPMDHVFFWRKDLAERAINPFTS